VLVRKTESWISPEEIADLASSSNSSKIVAMIALA
jgi:hypothetical protein